MQSGGGGKSKNALRRAKKKAAANNNNNNSNKDGNATEEEFDKLKLPIDSVVKVYATLSAVSYATPWLVEPSEDVSGSGFIFECNGKKKVVTNAHCVANASFLLVRRLGEAQKVKARIEHISHELDLAVLSVDKPSFFEGLKPLQTAAGEPYLQDEVYVAGYPEGGDTLSVTKGIVSRIEAGPYTETLELLTIQIDAAINPGNSGGPVFGQNNKMIGVAFAGLDHADNIGYIIPVRILSHFLESIRRFGSFSGVCRLGVKFQMMENEALAKYKRLGDRTGVLVTQVDPCSPCFGSVLVGDVLLRIDGVEIADDGTVRWRKHERVNLDFMIQSRYAGDFCALELLRDGATVQCRIQLSHLQPLVLDTLAAPATYVFFGGLVLVPFSTPFLDSYDDDAPDELNVLLRTAHRKQRDEELVVLSSVIADELTMGYEEFEGEVLKEINGTKVLNLKHAHELLTAPNLPDMIILVFGENSLACFERAEVQRASKKIMRRHKIPKETNLFDVVEPDE